MTVRFIVDVDMNGDEKSEASKDYIKNRLNEALAPFAQSTYGYTWTVTASSFRLHYNSAKGGERLRFRDLIFGPIMWLLLKLGVPSNMIPPRLVP